MNTTLLTEALAKYEPNFIMVGFEVANQGTNFWFGSMFVAFVFIISLIAMRDNQGEVTRTLSMSFIFSLMTAVILLAMEQIIEAHVIILGILTVISLIFQKTSEN